MFYLFSFTYLSFVRDIICSRNISNDIKSYNTININIHIKIRHCRSSDENVI